MTDRHMGGKKNIRFIKNSAERYNTMSCERCIKQLHQGGKNDEG
jgi:hypothetical protein